MSWCNIAWLPLTFTVIGQNKLMNIYYQSEIVSSPHRITVYESAQPIQTFVLQTTKTMARLADIGNEDLEAILELS
jgi:hypothetical protein